MQLRLVESTDTRNRINCADFSVRIDSCATVSFCLSYVVEKVKFGSMGRLKTCLISKKMNRSVLAMLCIRLSNTIILLGQFKVTLSEVIESGSKMESLRFIIAFSHLTYIMLAVFSVF